MKNKLMMKKLQNNPLEARIQELEQEIQEIKNRNAEKDGHKAWETSKFRRVSIALLTYAVMILFMGSIGVDQPEINAVIPTIGFVLSTFSLTLLRKVWERSRA